MIFHIRKTLRPAGGNQFYRDRSNRYAGTFCGADPTDHDVLPRGKAEVFNGWEPCGQCLMLRGRTMSTEKLLEERVESEWDEFSTNDGYWMSLRPGWTLDDCTAIHQNTRKECLARLPECRFGTQRTP